MALSDYPRTILAHTPTPLELMPNFSDWLGGPNVYIKRDDCTGLAMGGNKARQLEYYLGEALARKADTIIITGAVQSNFARQAAAAARKLGMDIHIQLENRVANKDHIYHKSGNVLLDRLLGATIHYFPTGDDEDAADRALDQISDEIQSTGGNPYVIHLGMSHTPLGALGYVESGLESVIQARDCAFSLDAIVIASGSGATHSGFLVGLRHSGEKAPVYGICTRRDAIKQKARVQKIVSNVAKMVDANSKLASNDIIVRDDWLGSGYGELTDEIIEALKITAHTEGILLDPVYTAKAMAGLIGLGREGTLRKDQNVVFVHTGGTPALFGYGQALT